MRGSLGEGRGSLREGRERADEGRGSLGEGRERADEGRGSLGEGRERADEGSGSLSEGRGRADEGRGSLGEGRGRANDEGRGSLGVKRETSESEIETMKDLLYFFLSKFFRLQSRSFLPMTTRIYKIFSKLCASYYPKFVEQLVFLVRVPFIHLKSHLQLAYQASHRPWEHVTGPQIQGYSK